jgi:Leucine-rich repeat (LRR) protein
MKAILNNNDILYFENFTELFDYQCIEKIQYLDCDNMKISELPNTIIKLSNLMTLSLNHNLLTFLPINLPPNLKTIYLNFNYFKEVPKEICNLSNLEILLMYSNKISSITPEINKLKNLKVLGLSYNILSNIPKEIGELKKLNQLELKENNIFSLPKTIIELQNLKTLSLSNNKLSRLPKKMDKLVLLEILDLDNNSLSFIPKEIFTLTNLVGISVNFNKLNNLPKIIQKSSIKYVSCIYNNLNNNYEDERIIINANNLKRIDSILTIRKLNNTYLKNELENNLLEMIKKTVSINI